MSRAEDYARIAEAFQRADEAVARAEGAGGEAMTVADFLSLSLAEQDGEVARWMGWLFHCGDQDNDMWPCWKRGEELLRGYLPPRYVSGGWAEFGEMLATVNGDIVIKRIGPAWLIGLSQWWTDSGTPLPPKHVNPNLALALALGRALGTLKECTP